MPVVLLAVLTLVTVLMNLVVLVERCCKRRKSNKSSVTLSPVTEA
jgi:hypothetical protein